MLHTLKTSQFIKADMNTVWAFMSSPINLATITPKHLSFDILSDKADLEKMYAGQIIEYHVKPLLGIKLHWVTEITQVVDRKYFIDEQRFGPYAFWHHKHFFEEKNGGVLMQDIIHYKLPLGFIGKIGNALYVKNQLKEIFDYRTIALDKMFNSNGS
jgi:ligand-binding SRPBCC domain-containing protein